MHSITPGTIRVTMKKDVTKIDIVNMGVQFS